MKKYFLRTILTFFLFFTLCIFIRGFYSYAVSMFLGIPASLQLNVHFPFALAASIASVIATFSVENKFLKQMIAVYFVSLIVVFLQIFFIDLRRSVNFTTEFLVMSLSPWIVSLGLTSIIVSYFAANYFSE